MNVDAQSPCVFVLICLMCVFDSSQLLFFFSISLNSSFEACYYDLIIYYYQNHSNKAVFLLGLHVIYRFYHFSANNDNISKDFMYRIITF